MSNGVDFDVDVVEPSHQFPERKKASLTDWVIKNSCGLIKNELQANYFFVGFLLFTIIVSVLFYRGVNPTVGKHNDIKILPAEL